MKKKRISSNLIREQADVLLSKAEKLNEPLKENVCYTHECHAYI